MASHRPLHTQRLTILPADAARLETLLSSPGAFTLVTGCKVAEGFCPFEGALMQSLNSMRRAGKRDRPWWTPRLLVLTSITEVVGILGFKGPPSDGLVEVGYSVAPVHQNQGIATEALSAIGGHVLRFFPVQTIRAHTLPQASASTRVLEKSGFRKVAEIVDPEDGLVWRWERERNIS